jgi:hypothetical protein
MSTRFRKHPDIKFLETPPCGGSPVLRWGRLHGEANEVTRYSSALLARPDGQTSGCSRPGQFQGEPAVPACGALLFSEVIVTVPGLRRLEDGFSPRGPGFSSCVYFRWAQRLLGPSPLPFRLMAPYCVVRSWSSSRNGKRIKSHKNPS